MSKCTHISLLPKIPDGEELISGKPQSKKIKPPLVEDGDNGGHEELGYFTVQFKDSFFIEWNLKNKKRKNKVLRICASALILKRIGLSLVG